TSLILRLFHGRQHHQKHVQHQHHHDGSDVEHHRCSHDADTAGAGRQTHHRAGSTVSTADNSMRNVLLALLLLQVDAPRNGIVTGVVLSGSGIAAAGVRVYAVPAGDPNVAAVAGSVFVGLVQTDSAGKYRLEVPAGRYYIAAGSVESPT